MSPGTSRKPLNPWDRPLSSSVSSGGLASSPASSVIVLPEAPLTRKQANPVPAPTWSTQGPSRRLSRTIHIPTRPTHSGQSSRSTSRSRSPLPTLQTHASFADYGPPSSSSNRRSSRIIVDDPIDPIMAALYEIIGVATDVLDTSVSQLTAQPKACESLVQRVQNIGKAWDENPDWQGRNWYVQVLLAIAGLSRVVEWWEAEKQFWNFDDDDELDEPLTFVMKPADDSVPPAPTPTTRRGDMELEGFKLNPEDEHKLRMSRQTSQNRRPRDDSSKPVNSPPKDTELSPRGASKVQESNESARVLATERLRLQAETAQNQNIVIELSLDGDRFIWVNHAWSIVVGYGFFSLSIEILLIPRQLRSRCTYWQPSFRAHSPRRLSCLPARYPTSYGGRLSYGRGAVQTSLGTRRGARTTHRSDALSANGR